jgi:putative PIN family toxin of toxin-antitoxin system
MLIVPDIHVYISGTTTSSPGSYTAVIINAWEDHRLQFATSEPILAELSRVLNYPDIVPLHEWSTEQNAQFVEKIRQNAHLVPGKTPVSVCQDPDDDKFFACALEAKAPYIVSKDKKILNVGEWQGIHTVKPGYFVEQVLKQKKVA